MTHELPDIIMLPIENIEVPEGRRRVNPADVARIAESIKTIGLRTPISVRHLENPEGQSDRLILVAGAHRLAAAKLLGWEEIPAFVVEEEPDADAKMWEIAENLHRADLTALERAELEADYVRLVENKLAQLAPVYGGRGNEGGVREAARKLGVERTKLQRSVNIAGLPKAAKDMARATGLDNNQQTLLKAAASDDAETFLRNERVKRNAERFNPKQSALLQQKERLQAANEFAEWIFTNDHKNEIAMIVNWIRMAMPRDIIEAIGRIQKEVA